MTSRCAERLRSASPEMREYLLESPRYFSACDDRQAVRVLLTDLYFIEAKCAAGMVLDLQADYERAKQLWPEGQRDARTRTEQELATAQYIVELVSFAKHHSALHIGHEKPVGRRELRPGNVTCPVPPSSISSGEPSTNRQPEKDPDQPAQYNRVDAFSEFVRTQSHALGSFSRHEGFCAQQAYNAGLPEPLAQDAQQSLEETHSPYIELMARSDAAARNAGKPNQTLVTEESTVRCLAMTPDAKCLVLGGDTGLLHVWMLNPARCLATLGGHPDRIFSAAVSADATLAVSGDYDGWMCIWDLKRQRLLKCFKAHEGFVSSMALTPDGRMAFSGGSDGLLHVWSVGDGQCLCTLKDEHIGEASAVAASCDARYLISGHMWDVDGDRNTVFNLLNLWTLGQDIQRRPLPQVCSVNCVDMTPDGSRVVSGDCNGNIAVWTVQTGELLWREHVADSVGAVAIAHDGMSIASVGPDGYLRTWDMRSHQCLFAVETAHFGASKALAVSADCSCVATSGLEDAMIKLWVPDVCQDSPGNKGHSGRTQDVILDTSRNRVVSKGSDGALCLWDSASGDLLNRFDVNIESFSPLATSLSAGLLAWTSYGDALFAFDYGSEGETRCLCRGIPYDGAARITPDGTRIVSTRLDGTCELWDVQTAERLAYFEWGGKGGCTLDLSPDGRLLRASCGNIWRVVDLASGRIVACNLNLPVRASGPDGRLGCSNVVSGELRVFDLHTGIHVKTLHGEPHWFYRVQVGPKGHRVAFAETTLGPASLYIWDWRSGARWQSTDRHEGVVTGLTFTPDGLHLVSTSVDKTLRVWDVETGRCCGVCYDASGYSCISKASPQGTLAVGTESGRVTVVTLRNLERKAPVVTAVRLWQFSAGHGRWDENLTTVCPWCGNRITVPDDVKSGIDDIAEACALPSGIVASLGLPDEAWHEERLLSPCPACRQQVRFNPFVVDNRDLCSVDRIEPAHIERNAVGRTSGMVVERCALCGEEANDLTTCLHRGGVIHAQCMVTLADSGNTGELSIQDAGGACMCCGEDCEADGVETLAGAVCPSCYRGAFEMISHAVDLGSWRCADFVLALSNSADVLSRLTVLRRFYEVLEHIQGASHDELVDLRDALAANLGYVSMHPLASDVRQLALNHCVSLGKEMIPSLLRARRDDPWQLHANILMALGSIDPLNSHLQALLLRASKDPRPQIRARVPLAVEDCETQWSRSLVESMLDDAEEEVSLCAYEVVDTWDIEAGRMSEDDKDFRSFVLPLAKNPDPNVRQQVPRSLVKYSATWAKVLAKKMATDPDETVRLEVRKLLDAWNELSEQGS